MTGPTKALVAGVLVGALVFATGSANTCRLERRGSELKVTCIEDGKTSDLAKLGGELICDPIELARSTGDDPPGVQGNLARAQRQLLTWQQWPIPIAFLVVVAFGLPWAWCFLLRRIRELREALLGK